MKFKTRNWKKDIPQWKIKLLFSSYNVNKNTLTTCKYLEMVYKEFLHMPTVTVYNIIIIFIE